MRDFIISFIAMWVLITLVYLVLTTAIAFILLDATIISASLNYATFRIIIVVALIMTVYDGSNNWRNK